MMLLYADVYCQSNCLSAGCQVLRGVIHNNNRAKPESGHWAGHLKKPVRDLGKFPTHHRSPAHPILSSALLQVAKSQITLRRTVYKQYQELRDGHREFEVYIYLQKGCIIVSGVESS